MEPDDYVHSLIYAIAFISIRLLFYLLVLVVFNFAFYRNHSRVYNQQKFQFDALNKELMTISLTRLLLVDSNVWLRGEKRIVVWHTDAWQWIKEFLVMRYWLSKQLTDSPDLRDTHGRINRLLRRQIHCTILWYMRPPDSIAVSRIGLSWSTKRCMSIYDRIDAFSLRNAYRETFDEMVMAPPDDCMDVL